MGALRKPTPIGLPTWLRPGDGRTPSGAGTAGKAGFQTGSQGKEGLQLEAVAVIFPPLVWTRA